MVTNRMSIVTPAGHTYDSNCDFDCNACGEYRDAPHTLTTHVEAVVPANCQEQGHNEYWVCEDCGGYFMSNGAGGYYETNPAWMYYTGEHVRPEGAAGCAVVTCELCGGDSYGTDACVRDESTPACQNGTCVNCGGTVYGEGHSYGYDEDYNSLIPLCQEGDCIYCGEHLDYIYECENGSYAPCSVDGECVYGCGKQYPATGVHAIDDPCVGGLCWQCWETIDPAHEYTSDCDTTCENCDNVRETEVAHEYFYACDAHCMNCGELTNEDASHTVNHVDAVEATCQAMGNIEYWYCSDCSGCWSDEALTMVTNRFNVVTFGDHKDVDGICEYCGSVLADGFIDIDGYTYYYLNGEALKGFQKIVDDYYYFHPGTGKLWKDCTLYVGENDYGISPARYNFDAEGKLILTGFVTRADGYTYYIEDGVELKGFQKVGDDYYYFHVTTGKMYTECQIYVGENEWNIGPARYNFGADGKLVKNGFITKADGATYYYEDTVPATGLIEVEGNYYLLHAKSGKLYKDTTVWVGDNDLGLARGRYTVDENGVIQSRTDYPLI